MKRETIAVAGALAQRPDHGGHTWVFLQYLLGFRRLGYDVVFIDRLEPAMCTEARGSRQLQYLASTMERIGLGDRWSLLFDGSREVFGLGRPDLLAALGRSVLLLNIMGYLDDEELLAATPLRVFLDIDPGFPQMWRALGLHDAFGGHDAHVTIGENLGSPECSVPVGGIEWITTRPPVVLGEWPGASGVGRRFTTVAAWRGPFGPVDYEGRTYGLRVHEFRRFLDLPRRTGADFELALSIDGADHDDVRRLRENGWALAEPRVVAADPWTYRDYVRSSMAEFMVAKNMYVQSRSGWFSDRSACYLACGRPVLAQETGFSSALPTGKGLLSFSSVDDAIAGVDAITADPLGHGRAARAVAEEFFDSDRVLGRLLGRLGVA